jgi:hypothetical protein
LIVVAMPSSFMTCFEPSCSANSNSEPMSPSNALCACTCEHCGGAVKVIASIEDPAVIKKILDHLARRAEAATPVFRPFARAPPQHELPGLKQPG